MKTSKYYKQMVAVMAAVVVISLFWLYWTIGRVLNTLLSGGVALREGYESIQISIAVGYCLFAVALMIVQLVFMAKQLKSIKSGIVFAKSSAKYLGIWAVLWVFYDFCSCQVGNMIASGVFNQITVEGTTIGIPVIVIMFAILYKMAADVAEENNLTI